MSDEYGETPLLEMAYNGYDRVLKMLLGRNNFNSDKSDEFDGVPRFQAATMGDQGVVEMLLGRENFDPDRPDMYR